MNNTERITNLLNSVSENRLLGRWAAIFSRSPQQIGKMHETDAELLPLGNNRLLALTIDTVAEEIHLSLYRSPYLAGEIAVVASLSDLAAVGAEPLGLLVAASLPKDQRNATQEAVARGIEAACRAHDTYVLGGDTNEAEDLAITCVAAGIVPQDQVLFRSGCAPGERIFASGLLGAGSALGAAVFLGLEQDADKLVTGSWQPQARLTEGYLLRGLATTCMDTSDGLVTTLDQLARLNGIAIHITRPPVQLLEPTALAIHERSGLPALAFLASQVGEFELVFTVPENRCPELARRAATCNWKPIELGYTEQGFGLFIQGHPIDGARVRNLWYDSAGDVSSYLGALCAL
ncbi:MAG: thiamine-monophosphate kinase [Cyanobacteria bacterium NC_groundwater_1444_Ag_S-0.65um_54_12]|nr:thiamine-monophosphate kinase [Cyanobacteria bacterium NC_groundwater_1444_Ag_S-0.65um_54_12]